MFIMPVMKIMKYAIQPAVFYEPLENFLESYDYLDFLPFNNLTNSNIIDSIESKEI